MSAEPWYAGRRPSLHPAGTPGAFLTELHNPEWMDSGLCAQTDPEVFFPEKGGSSADAKATCRRCDVREQCLAYAIEHQERFGIWGGLSERERRRLTNSPNTGPRPCRRPGCAETIPITAHAAKRYHSPDCANRAREDLHIANLDQPRVVTAYTAGAPINALAKQHSVPIPVIVRVLDDHGVRRTRGRRTPEREAS